MASKIETVESGILIVLNLVCNLDFVEYTKKV